MKRNSWIKIGLAVVGLLALMGLIGYFMIFHNQKTKVCFQDVCFNVEVAKNKFTVARGLMFRKSLGAREGMLFVFENEGKRSFWMKNTLIPLDIVWLDKNKKVVNIAKQTQPCQSDKCLTYRNQNPAKYVLEISAGLSEKIGLRIGSEVLFSASK